MGFLGKLPYALRVILNPHGVFVQVGDQLARDGRNDIAGRDMAQARAKTERVFGVCWDQRRVYCFARENEWTCCGGHDGALVVVMTFWGYGGFWW